MMPKKAKTVEVKEDKAIVDMNNRTGYFREDDSGHWYFIPEAQIETFKQLHNMLTSLDDASDEFYDAVDEFETAFAKCRINGGPQSHKVFLIDKVKRNGK